jgi:hypothetical protein
LLTKVKRAKFCANNVRNKLEAFRVQLKAANEGTDVTEEELYQFPF